MSALPLPFDFIFGDTTTPIVCFDLFSTLIHEETLQFKDIFIPHILELIRANGFTLLLFSSASEQITKALLRDVHVLFHYSLYDMKHSDLVSLGKSEREMIFFSSRVTASSKPWILPFDVPLCSQVTEIFDCDAQECSDSDEVANLIFEIRSKWISMRTRVRTSQLALHSPDEQFSISYKLPSEQPCLPHTKKPMTIALDLDGTLIHSHRCEQGLSVSIRPHARQLLHQLSLMKDKFEVIMFTAASRTYAEPIIKHIDTNNTIDYMLTRRHCSKLNNHYIKELSKMGRSRYVIVDDNQFSFILNRDESIHVKNWTKDQSMDTELLEVINTIKMIHSDVENSQKHIRRHKISQRNKSM